MSLIVAPVSYTNGMPNPVPIATPHLPPPNPTLSQAARLGELLFVSGQLGIDPATGAVVTGGQVAEYRQALRNLKYVLEAAGSSLEKVVKTTIYMTDITELAELNRLYAEYFPHAPAKTGVEVKALAMGGKIEIEAIAAQ
jgi:reactive intermediate/imine deaminase